MFVERTLTGFGFERSHTAFVLSLFDTGLGAVRSLGRMGIPVVGLDPDPRMPGFRSRFRNRYIRKGIDLVLSWMLWPFKYLDALSKANDMPSGVFLVGRKVSED